MEPTLHPYGMCYHDIEESLSTGVIEYLRETNIKLVIVGGLAAEYCVKTTITQLVKAGFTVILNKSATRGLWYEVSEADLYSSLSDLGVILVDNAEDIAGFVSA